MHAIKKRVKRRIPFLMLFLLLLVGICILMYPRVSDLIMRYTAYSEIASYNAAVKVIDKSEIKKLQKLAQEYNEALAEGNTDKSSITDYDSLLAVTEAIGYVDVPKVNIYLPIFHGLTGDILQRGVGHMEGTSLPIGGKSTHCVLAAHTGLPTADLFTNIDQLVLGDVFYIHVLDETLAYRVDQIKIVLPDNTDDIKIVENKDYVTLLTCTPYGVNDHRLLVRGTRIPYKEPYDPSEQDAKYPMAPTESADEEVIPLETLLSFWGTVAVLLVVIIILLILFLPIGRNKNKKQAKS